MKTYSLRNIIQHYRVTSPRSSSIDEDVVYQYLKEQVHLKRLQTMNPNKPKYADHIISDKQVRDWMIEYRPDLAIENNLLPLPK